jgi:hypothetical protein
MSRARYASPGRRRDADFAEAAWAYFERSRHVVEGAVDGVLRSRRWREVVSRDEALSEAVSRLPGALRTYDPALGASLDTHVTVALRHYVHKLCVRLVYGEHAVRTGRRVVESLVVSAEGDHAQVEDRGDRDPGAWARGPVQEMLEAVGRVHPLYRWLLERRYLDGLTLDDIAALLRRHKSSARRYMWGAEDAARRWAEERRGEA